MQQAKITPVSGLPSRLASFRHFCLRTPNAWVQESARRSPKFLKRRLPRLYYHIGLQQFSAWRRHAKADVHFLSFPKCGRTWLRQLVGRSLVQHFGLDGVNHVDIRRLGGLHADVPEMLMHHDDDIFWKTPEELTPHRDWYRGKRVVLLVRRPKDVLVSSYFQKAQREQTFNGSLSDFVDERCGGIDTLLEYYNIWQRCSDVPKSLLVISYEQLHADCAGTLRRVMDFMGLEVMPDGVLDEAVEFASFSRMRKREAAGKAGRETGGESLKARKGQVGGHAEYLSDDEVERLDRRIADKLLPDSPAQAAWTV